MCTDSASVVAIVLNWNNFDDSAKCIQDLQNQSYKDLNILLVDNGSTDGSAEKLQREFEEVEMVWNDQNLGFTGGMNKGIQEALSHDSEFILLVNNDIRLPKSNVVANLVSKFQATSSLGALSPCFSSPFESLSALRAYLPNVRNGRSGQQRFNDKVSDPDLSYGCHYGFVLLSRNILELVGGFDEKYFLYFEDIEHGARIEDRGYYLATDETITVKHESHGSSGSPIGPLPSYYEARNRLLFMKEYNSSFEFSYLIPIFIWWFCTRFAYRLYRGNTAGAIALLEGVVDAIRGNFGKGPYP